MQYRKHVAIFRKDGIKHNKIRINVRNYKSTIAGYEHSYILHNDRKRLFQVKDDVMIPDCDTMFRTDLAIGVKC